MYYSFNDFEIKKARDKITDDACERHVMTPEHTEILGQFLDTTALSPAQLKEFLMFSADSFSTDKMREWEKQKRTATLTEER